MSDWPVQWRGALATQALSSAHPPTTPDMASRWASPVTSYGAALGLVALATGLAFSLEDVIGAPNLTLVFVLPVIAAATWFGWGPALLATAAGVLAFDYFFTEPKYSLEIASPHDIAAAALLLVIAAVVSAVAARSRRRERAAREAAEQARALQSLAHVIIESGRSGEVFVAAATALHQIFHAPTVIFMRRAGALQAVASAGDARITPAEEEAARCSLETHVRCRADAYPFVKSRFDFWPVTKDQDGGCVIGVEAVNSRRAQPAEPDRFIEIVGGYLATALNRPAEAAGGRWD